MSAGRFFYVFCALLFGGGSLFAIVTPPFQVPDEAGHYSRAYELSRGMCFPPATLKLPAAYREDMARFRGRIEETPVFFSGRLLATEFERFGFFRDAGPDVDGFVDPSEDIYLCALYVPAAAGLEIARPFGPTLIASLLVARLCNVLFCGLIAIAGYRLMPFAKEAYAFVALLPMALHQLGSVSEDAVVNALALFGTAYILRLAVRSPHRVLARQTVAGLLVLSAIMGLAKINILLLGLLLIVPSSRFGSLRRRIAVVGGCFAVAAASLALAPRLALISSTVLLDWIKSENFRMLPNARFLAAHPLVLFTDLITTIHVLWMHYLAELIGTFGWLSFELPFPMVAFASLTLIVLGFRSVVPARSRNVVRVATIALSIGSFLALWTALFVTAENFDNLPKIVAGWTADGSIMQGRYYLPFVLIPALALAVRRTRGVRIDRFLCLFSSAVSIATSLATIAVSFRL